MLFLKKGLEHVLQIINTTNTLGSFMAVCLIIELLSVKSPTDIKLSRDSKNITKQLIRMYSYLQTTVMILEEDLHFPQKIFNFKMQKKKYPWNILLYWLS